MKKSLIEMAFTYLHYAYSNKITEARHDEDSARAHPNQHPVPDKNSPKQLSELYAAKAYTLANAHAIMEEDDEQMQSHFLNGKF